MFLLEHDAKELLAAEGFAVPAGTLIRDVRFADAALPPGPWMVKAQIAAGGRGKAGLIRSARNTEELRAALHAILGATHQGVAVRACRIEQQVAGAAETYLSFLLDPVTAGVRVIVAAQGGVEIEALAAIPGAIRSASAAPDPVALAAQADALTRGYPAHTARALSGAGRELAQIFLAAELALLEVNPLFVRPDGSWIAGDTKIVTDDNALYRQSAQRALLESRREAYPAAYLKLRHGCDYVVVDPEGEIGLLTTGAGLSMMLIDELRAAGFRPYNFLDVRTGGLRGDPARLVNVLEWIAEGRRVRVLLVNIFAGITDLGEFARLLCEALARVPRLRVPIVARMAGTGLEAARAYLAGSNIPVVTDLDAALEHVRRHLGAS